MNRNGSRENEVERTSPVLPVIRDWGRGRSDRDLSTLSEDRYLLRPSRR